MRTLVFISLQVLLWYSCQSEAKYPEVKHPGENQPSEARIALGKKLFFDPRLSIDNTVSCASCHNPERAFTDGKKLSDGVQGGKSFRNTPTLINVAYQSSFMFEGAIPTLERQVHVPIIDPNEMGYVKIIELVEKLAAIDEYQYLAKSAYDRSFDVFVLTRSLAAFVRTLVSWDSEFDDFYFGGTALNPEVMRGYQIFTEELYCAKCHPAPFFTDFALHNNGFYDDSDWGRWRITGKESDKGTFKTPTLKQLMLTAPYMHNGNLKTLEEVIDYYANGGSNNPNQDKLIQPFELSEKDKNALIRFLKSI